MTCPYAAQKYKKKKSTRPKTKKHYKKKAKKSSKKRKSLSKKSKSYPTSLSRYTKSCSMLAMSDLKKTKCFKKLKSKKGLKTNVSICKAIIKSCPRSWRLGMTSSKQPKAVKKLVKAIKKAKKTGKPVVINSPVANLSEPNKLFVGPCRENEVRDAYSGKCVLKAGTFDAVKIFGGESGKSATIKDVSAPAEIKAEVAAVVAKAPLKSALKKKIVRFATSESNKGSDEIDCFFDYSGKHVEKPQKIKSKLCDERKAKFDKATRNMFYSELT